MIRELLRTHRELLAAVLLFAVCSPFSTLLFYKELATFHAFPYFANEMNTVGTALVCLLFSLTLYPFLPPLTRRDEFVVLPDVLESSPSHPSPPHPLKGLLGGAKFLLILGLLNAVQNTLQNFSIIALGPSRSTLTILVNQAVIPLTVIIKCVRRRKITHHWLQLAGAAMVVVGVVVVLWPQLVSKGPDDPTDHVSAGGVVLWMSLYLVSCIPQALLNVLLEEAFMKEGEEEKTNPQLSSYRHHPVTVLLRALVVVGMFNLVAAPASMLLVLIMSLIQDGTIHPLQRDMVGGWALLTSSPEHGQQPWVVVAQFMPLGSLWVLSGVLLDHYGSATAMFLVTAMCLPLQNAMLSLRALMGKDAGAALTSNAWVGLGVIVCGLLGYAFGALRAQKGSREELEEEGAHGYTQMRTDTKPA